MLTGCLKGGAVDPNMAATYEAAKAVGIASIDAYMFPCNYVESTPAPHYKMAGTGTQPTRVACKSISIQTREFLGAIDSNNIQVNHLWLDTEPEDACQPVVACNAWRLGSTGNEALAKQWAAPIEATGRNCRIYAS